MLAKLKKSLMLIGLAIATLLTFACGSDNSTNMSVINNTSNTSQVNYIEKNYSFLFKTNRTVLDNGGTITFTCIEINLNTTDSILDNNSTLDIIKNDTLEAVKKSYIDAIDMTTGDPSRGGEMGVAEIDTCNPSKSGSYHANSHDDTQSVWILNKSDIESSTNKGDVYHISDYDSFNHTKINSSAMLDKYKDKVKSITIKYTPFNEYIFKDGKYQVKIDSATNTKLIGFYKKFCAITNSSC